jgi:hypothetical protein
VKWSEGLPVTPPWDSLVGHPNQNKIGDYYHMVSDPGGAALAFAATFNGEQDVYFLRVGDCNANGQHDADDISGGSSDDCDFNRVPDECQDAVNCLTCDNDGTCQQGENCDSCPDDCFASEGGCGNGTCELAIGEDCLSCPTDCNGVQQGNPGTRFCCGDGDGTNPVGCGDARCTSGAFQCSTPLPPATCCGDGFCEGTEDESNCFADCVFGTPGETSHHDVPGDQMRVTGYEDVTAMLDITYTPACDATQHTIYLGDLASVSSYAYTSAECDVGVSGAASFAPGPDDVFYVIVGHDGAREGSYGADGDGLERPEDTGTPGCDQPQELSGVICE